MNAPSINKRGIPFNLESPEPELYLNNTDTPPSKIINKMIAEKLTPISNNTQSENTGSLSRLLFLVLTVCLFSK